MNNLRTSPCQTESCRLYYKSHIFTNHIHVPTNTLATRCPDSGIRIYQQHVSIFFLFIVRVTCYILRVHCPRSVRRSMLVPISNCKFRCLHILLCVPVPDVCDVQQQMWIGNRTLQQQCQYSKTMTAVLPDFHLGLGCHSWLGHHRWLLQSADRNLLKKSANKSLPQAIFMHFISMECM